MIIITFFLSVKYNFRNLTIFHGCAIVISCHVGELEGHLLASDTLKGDFSEAFRAIVRVKALWKIGIHIMA